MKQLSALILCCACACPINATEMDSVADTREMPEFVFSGGMKQFGTLAAQPMSAQKLSVHRLRESGHETLKSMAQTVPNLFYPEYGSRLTPAIYIRGIGSRANTPVVGLYVDDVALMEKSSFDFSLADAERVEVLRGPQSTLYGRNAMGGVMKVYTATPLQEGRQTEFRLGGSTEDAMRNMYVHHSNLLAEGLGISVGAFYHGSNGYNRNVCLNRRSNGSETGGGRLRLAYKRNPRFALDFQTSGEYSDEDAYDYRNTTNGRIESGFLGGYRRGLLNSSLKMVTEQPRFTLTSVTAYQYLKDHMRMDQDYSPADLFRLEQCQRSHSLSEEVALKGTSRPLTTSSAPLSLDWTVGAYAAYQSMHTNAPVTFGQDGIQQLIQAGINQGMDAVNANPTLVGMGMSMSLNITDTQLTIPGLFDTPVTNAAAFGQVRLRDLWVRGLDLTAGLRLDYEHRSMDYNTNALINSHYYMTHGPRIPAPDIDLDIVTNSGYEGRLSDNQTRLLPRLALSYRWNTSDDNLVYASVSEGLRSGGYNFQMFSDLIQSSMRNDMMRSLAAEPSLAAYMSRFMPPVADNPSADSTTVFRPERSWNYEIGIHFNLLDRHLTASAALFYIMVRDQQITRFSASSGLGRQVLNAGKSQSCGMELSLSGWFNIARNPLQLTANYGYTHATFTDYDAGISEGANIDYDGNYLPFAPRHTFSASADYLFPVKNVTIDLGLDTHGIGRTYWTEDNSASQPYYQLLGAHIGARYVTKEQTTLSLMLWATNLTNKDYTPFYFVSRGQGFAQTNRPRQFGATFSVRF